MSWSFSCIDKTDAVVAALDAHSETLYDQCRAEFDDAKPHLKALVAQNFANEPGYGPTVIDFAASGSGSTRGSGESLKQIARNCTVSIQPLYKTLV